MDETPGDTFSKAKYDEDPMTETEKHIQESESIELQIQNHSADRPRAVSKRFSDEASEESQTEVEYNDVRETVRRGRGRPRVERTGRSGRPRKFFYDTDIFTEMAYSSKTSTK